MAELSNYGEILDLKLRQGATLGEYRLALTNRDTLAPLNITGWEFRAQIRKTPSNVVAATATFRIPVGTDGVVFWKFPATETVNIAADDNSPTAAASSYVWDMEAELPNGDVLALVYGNVNVLREVTKTTP